MNDSPKKKNDTAVTVKSRMAVDSERLKSRRKHRALTRTQVSQVRQLRLMGYTLAQIAVAIGVQIKSVWLACQEGYVGR